jgi:hypothetical protein
MRRRHRPEQQIHRAVVAHLRARGVAGVVFLHPANGGARSAIEGAIFKGLGVAAGAPDLLLWHAGRSFALELKVDSGRVSESQAEMLQRLSAAGVTTAVCHGVDRAVACLEGWGLLRGAASLRAVPQSDWDRMWSSPFGLTESEKAEQR